ncbi:MAG TPA: ESPR domain-containing protein, partial [Nitrospiraceae bacterium]|nr:ESPR domain-containing protein [Nitrospiraceae bacterium]
MNRVFRIVWSRALHSWVVVSELATRRGKGGGVDRRACADGITLGPLAAETSNSPWPLRLGILAALLALHAPSIAADR